MADKRWEYETEKAVGGISIDLLNEYGSRGWELVAVIPNPPLSTHLIFKREVPPDYSFFQAKIQAADDADADGAQRPERSEGP